MGDGNEEIPSLFINSKEGNLKITVDENVTCGLWSISQKIYIVRLLIHFTSKLWTTCLLSNLNNSHVVFILGCSRSQIKSVSHNNKDTLL